MMISHPKVINIHIEFALILFWRTWLTLNVSQLTAFSSTFNMDPSRR